MAIHAAVVVRVVMVVRLAVCCMGVLMLLRMVRVLMMKVL